MHFEEELKILEKISENSIYATKIATAATQYSGEVLLRYMKDGNVLELGPAEGIMTDILYPKFKDYTIVDGSQLFVNDLKKRYPDMKTYNSLFEQFSPKEKFSNIILGHVLEHVENPVEILKLCKTWLKEDRGEGYILAAVPNANSIHRQAAVEMGLMKKVNEFSEKDVRHGHRRVFFRDEFLECFNQAGLEIIKEGGYWLKPVSDKQIEESWTDEMINAFMKLGEVYPDIAAEIYVIAK